MLQLVRLLENGRQCWKMLEAERAASARSSLMHVERQRGTDSVREAPRDAEKGTRGPETRRDRARKSGAREDERPKESQRHRDAPRKRQLEQDRRRYTNKELVMMMVVMMVTSFCETPRREDVLATLHDSGAMLTTQRPHKCHPFAAVLPYALSLIHI